MPRAADDFVPNDTLLVLDLLTGAWLGIWKSDTFRLRRFMPYYDGTDPRVAILAADGEAYGMFPPGAPVTDDGTDIVSEARVSVRAGMEQSRSATLIAEVENIGGRYRLDSEADGVGETNTLRDRTPDPEASLKFGGTVDLTNANGDLWDPYREDYSFILSADGVKLPATGWQLGQRQRWTETVRIPKRGRAFTISCASQGGRVAFRSLAVQGVYNPVGRGTQV